MTTTALRFARFDLVSMARTQPLRIVLPLLFTVVFSVTLPVPGLGVVVGAVVASVSASIPFQGDERGRLDTLYGIAPIARRAVVVGRYLSMALFAVVAVGLGAVTTVVTGALRHQDVGWPLVATMLLGATACVGLAYAVQLPWFFALGFTRGRPMVYIPVAIIAVVGFVVGQAGWFGDVEPADLVAPSPMLVGIVVVAVAAAIAVSATIAVRLYQRREL